MDQGTLSCFVQSMASRRAGLYRTPSINLSQTLEKTREAPVRIDTDFHFQEDDSWNGAVQRRDLRSGLPHCPPVLYGDILANFTRVKHSPLLPPIFSYHVPLKNMIRRTANFHEPRSAFLAELRRSIVVKIPGPSIEPVKP